MRTYKRHFLDSGKSFFVQCFIVSGRSTHTLGFVDPMTNSTRGGVSISREVFSSLRSEASVKVRRKIRGKILRVMKKALS